MPHAFTWPAGGDIQQTHAKPPEGGYYGDWDPYAVALELTPLEDVNPVRTQHVLVATVLDKHGKPLGNRRVEWMISEGGVGDIVEVDESGWRASRGYKVDNHYAVSHTNNFDHVLDMGNDDPSDDVHLQAGQTWCVITSPIEGNTYITAYAPGIYDWNNHKVFAVKHWYDVAWEFPPPATNPIGTTHEFTTTVMKYSDGSPLAGHVVTYKIVDGPPAVFEASGNNTAIVETNELGEARVTIRQTTPTEGTNNVEVDIVRPADECCVPEAHIATGMTAKTWVGPKIGITKNCPSQKMVNEEFQYDIRVTNPSQVSATNVTVTDNLPDGIAYVSSNPGASAAGSNLSWSLGTLPAGESQAIQVTVRGTRTGTFENCAAVTADYGLSARDCCTTRIVAPQIVLEKQCTPAVTICDPIEYTLVVRNTGDGPATNVVVNDELPAGLVTDTGRRSLRADIGTLAAGQAKQTRFTVKAERTGSFLNRATATADGGLSAEAECTTVVSQPVLEVTKTGPEIRYIGRTAEYTITVTNTGDAPAVQTVLTDDIPAGTQFLSASDGGSAAGGGVSWNLGTLEPGASRKVTMSLKPMQPGTMRNTALARAICAEGSASTQMEVKGIPAILLEVIDVEDPIEVGATITYVIAVTNQGSAAGTNIKLACTLPQQLSYSSSDGPMQAAVDGPAVTFAALPSLAPKAKATFRVVAKGTAPGDVRFKVSMTTDQQPMPVEETESTNVY
ncbi:MAG TPA: DUF11 domain-containing protein [Phycisphaerae bacterium]|nr:DUF11 domain-containing protein [Phycisphaerae bacterium]